MNEQAHEDHSTFVRGGRPRLAFSGLGDRGAHLFRQPRGMGGYDISIGPKGSTGTGRAFSSEEIRGAGTTEAD